MAPDTLTVIHFGDIHFWRFGWPLADPWPKRALGLANLFLKRRHKFPPAVAQYVLDRLATEQADALLFSGDLTTTSLPAEFAAGAQAFAPLLARWGDRLVLIPGNHDRYTPGATRRRLFEHALNQGPREYPLTLEFNAHWTLIALDASQPHWITSRGRVGPAQLMRLDAQLTAARAAGRRVVVMCHYPVLLPDGREPSLEHGLIDRAPLRQLLEKHEVPLYLNGHHHHRWHFRSGPTTFLNCGSAGMSTTREHRQAGYIKFHLTPTGIENVQAHWLKIESLPEARWEMRTLAS